MSTSARCFDCFHDFTDDEPRFAVLKKMRDLDWTAYVDGELDEAERRRLDSLTFDQVLVCADCAGWYGDHPIGPLTADEAGA